jgi:hypothetical protein
MSLLGAVVGRIPGIPTKMSIGERLAGWGLGLVQGDADVVGHVRTPRGWRLVPAVYRTEGDDEYYRPVEGGRDYPAGGVGGDPGSLLGKPTAVGFADFGALRQLPNTAVARNVTLVQSTVSVDDQTGADSDEPEDDSELPEGRRARLKVRAGRIGQGALSLSATAAKRAVEWLRDGDKLPSKRRVGRSLYAAGLALIRGKKLAGKGYDADALLLRRDADGLNTFKRVDYSTDNDWLEPRDDEIGFSVDAIGAKPATLAGQPVAYTQSSYLRCFAPSAARLGRNMHEEKLTDGEELLGGDLQVTTPSGDDPLAVADGGTATVPEDAPEPQRAKTRTDDIIVEERAFVLPEDVSMLGDSEQAREKVKAKVERVRASEHLPGDDWASMAFRYGGIFMALIMGWWFGQQSAGGGGGGSLPSVNVPFGTMNSVEPMQHAATAADGLLALSGVIG